MRAVVRCSPSVRVITALVLLCSFSLLNSFSGRLSAQAVKPAEDRYRPLEQVRAQLQPGDIVHSSRPWDPDSAWGHAAKKLLRVLKARAPWVEFMALAGGQHVGVIDHLEGRWWVFESVTRGLERYPLMPVVEGGGVWETGPPAACSMLSRIGALCDINHRPLNLYDAEGRPIQSDSIQSDSKILVDLARVRLLRPTSQIDMDALRRHWMDRLQAKLPYDTLFMPDGPATFCAREVLDALRIGMHLSEEDLPRPCRIGELGIIHHLPKHAATAFYRERAAREFNQKYELSGIPHSDPQRSEWVAQALLGIEPDLPNQADPLATIRAFVDRLGIHATRPMLEEFERRGLLQQIIPSPGIRQHPLLPEELLLFRTTGDD